MKIKDVLAEYDKIIKSAIVLNPAAAPSAMEQLLNFIAQLPPDVQQKLAPQLQQLQQLPPDQQEQLATVLLQQIQMMLMSPPPPSPPSPQSATAQPVPMQSMPSQGQPIAVQPDSQGIPPTDLENTTVTLRLRDLLDLSSGGNATKSMVRAQEHLNKQRMKQQQQQQKMQEQQIQQQAGIQSPGIYS